MGKQRQQNGSFGAAIQGVSGISDEYFRDWRKMCVHVRRERLSGVPVGTKGSGGGGESQEMETVEQFELEIVQRMMRELKWAPARGPDDKTKKKKKKKKDKNGKKKKKKKRYTRPPLHSSGASASADAANGLLQLSPTMQPSIAPTR